MLPNFCHPNTENILKSVLHFIGSVMLLSVLFQ